MTVYPDWYSRTTTSVVGATTLHDLGLIALFLALAILVYPQIIGSSRNSPFANN